MLVVFDKNSREEWNDCVRSFKKWDIYYLYEYAYSLMCHGDGDIFLVYFYNKDERFCYVVMQKDIAKSDIFGNILETERYYDWETPYGYGGPLADCEITEQSQLLFLNEIMAYCQTHNIVSQFIRFHPLLNNSNLLPLIFEVQYMRDTVYIDTSSKETIFNNLDSKNRNMIRKAQKMGVHIEKRDIKDSAAFISLYNTTMKRRKANDFFYFEEEYYKCLNMMHDNAYIMYAFLDGNPVSAAIIFYNCKFMHYHLSGASLEGYKSAANNLLLYETACWAAEQGIPCFHLGGGLSQEDSLFDFKKQFNKKGRVPFVVGRTIFDQEKYDELLYIRKKADETFDDKNDFMIQYRR